MKNFDVYVTNQEPLPWTVIIDHPNAWLVGNDSLAINYVRFNLIMDSVQKYFRKDSVILDIGAYPGLMPKIFYEFYPKSNYEYYGCGLGFDKDFRERMRGFNVQLLECDLDPRLHLSKGMPTSIPLEDGKADFCIFTDVIEHFFDPFYPLKEANRVCKIGAIMILTTDNLARAALALIKGKSCNVPLIEGNMFYEGDWRPHFREYSKDELFQLLDWSGFEVLSHKFHDAEFGLYRVSNGRLVKGKRDSTGLIRKTKDFIISLLVRVIPYWKDSHILIARKKIDYQTMLKTAPKIVNNLEEWVLQRKAFTQKC